MTYKVDISSFFEMIDDARSRLGGDGPKITNDIIAKAFPETVSAATDEGCDRMFREGVGRAVASYIRKPPLSKRQLTLNDVDPEFIPLIEDLGSDAYYVPAKAGGGEYFSIPDLCHDKDMFNSARKFMRQKGEETLTEANRLDALFEAVFPQ